MAPKALPTATRAAEGAVARVPALQDGALRDELLLAGLVAFVFTVHTVASLALPNVGIWSTSPEDGFLLHLFVAMLGVGLVSVPTMLVHATLTWDATKFPPAESLACWLAAVAAVAVVATSFRKVPAWRRAYYAYLLAAILSQFAAVQWSTLGN